MAKVVRNEVSPKVEDILDFSEAKISHANYTQITLSNDEIELTFGVRHSQRRNEIKIQDRIFVPLTHYLKIVELTRSIEKLILEQIEKGKNAK